jgi:PIN domain nuclease of toxin-antitoxin system
MNNWLLDTNALIWLFQGSVRMDSARELFSLPETQVHISAVSWWEIAIKERTGKLPISIKQLESYVNQYDFIELPITRNYIKAYLELPHLHKDPFDHMLLAQAISCPMRLISGDSQLAEYSSLVMVV